MPNEVEAGNWLNLIEASQLAEEIIGSGGIVAVLRRAKHGDVSVSATRWHYTPENDLSTYDLCVDDSVLAKMARQDFLTLLHDVERGVSTWASFSTSCHLTGDYEIGSYEAQQSPNGWHSLTGLRFNRQSLTASFGLQRPPRAPEITSDNAKLKLRGGRSLTHHHAYAAAMVTLELQKLPPRDLHTSTLASVAAMLEPHYRTTHRANSAPDPDTLEQCAREILEAVRSQDEK